jgi:hypothetical protein
MYAYWKLKITNKNNQLNSIACLKHYYKNKISVAIIA